MSIRTKMTQTHDQELSWKYTAAAYLYFTLVTALVASALPSTQDAQTLSTVSAATPFVSMLEHGPAVQGFSKVSSVHSAQRVDHGTL